MGKTVVVGAGVIGLLAAYELARRGEQVAVYDRGQPGAACSAGNAGWVVPSFAGPLPGPGLVAGTLLSMLRPASPVYVRPRLDPALAAWLREFWRHCNVRDYHAGYDAVAALSRRTMACFDSLEADGIEFEMHRTGLLFVFVSRASRERHARDLERLTSHGYAPPRELSGADVREMEPALSPAITGGLLLPEERHVRPETLAAGLARRLAAMAVPIHAGVEVTGVARRGREVRAVVTAEGEAAADRVLLAAGAWSGVLARRLGFALPVLAGKGYSITVTRPPIRLGRAVHLGEAWVACSPFRDALRVAGTVEITAVGPAVSRFRVAALRDAASRYLPTWAPGAGEVEWMGMRPFLPDGLPAIGRAPGFDNVYVATGHGMLGVTLAPATGAAIADVMVRGGAGVDLAPFDPGRFARK